MISAQKFTIVLLTPDHRTSLIRVRALHPAVHGETRTDSRLRFHPQNQRREFRKQRALPAPYSWSKD